MRLRVRKRGLGTRKRGREITNLENMDGESRDREKEGMNL